MEENTVTPTQAYEDLANAIIIQAVKDFKSGYQPIQCMKFFKSDWYKCLTTFPSEAIIKIAKDKNVKIASLGIGKK